MDSLIKVGSTITMHFTLKLSDNTVAETTKKTSPVHIKLTEASLIDPVERSLIGKKAGEKVRVELSPEEGYGQVLPENIHVIARQRFSTEVLLTPGDIYEFSHPSGQTLVGIIQVVKEDSVIVDFNHPLAGKTLLCELDILEVLNTSD